METLNEKKTILIKNNADKAREILNKLAFLEERGVHCSKTDPCTQRRALQGYNRRPYNKKVEDRGEARCILSFPISIEIGR